jgi:hypothetical protein
MTLQRGGNDYNPAGFSPIAYPAAVAMNGTALGYLIDTRATKVRVYNAGATTESMYVAFGTTELLAEAALVHATNIATRGYFVPAAADVPTSADVIFTVPPDAKYIAFENAVAGDTQTVFYTYGV